MLSNTPTQPTPQIDEAGIAAKVLDAIDKSNPLSYPTLSDFADALLNEVLDDLIVLDSSNTELDRSDPEHPVNILLDLMQERVVDAIGAMSDNEFWAYAQENGVVINPAAQSDFLNPDRNLGGIHAPQDEEEEDPSGNVAYEPAAGEARTRRVLTILLGMKASQEIVGEIEVTPGTMIENQVRSRPYNLISFSVRGDVNVQLFVCDEQRQAAYGLRGDTCLSQDELATPQERRTKQFLVRRGGEQLAFTESFDRDLKSFCSGTKRNRNAKIKITDDYLRGIVDVFKEMNSGKIPSELSRDVFVRDGEGNYVPNGDTFKSVAVAMRENFRGWSDPKINSFAEWLVENNYKEGKDRETRTCAIPLTPAYLKEIVDVHIERTGGLPVGRVITDAMQVFVRANDGGFIANGDTFAAVNGSMNQRLRGWSDPEIKTLSQWLLANGYGGRRRRSNIPVTDKYLHEIVSIHIERTGNIPTERSNDVYVKDNQGNYRTNGDTFSKVRDALYHQRRGWTNPEIHTLSEWLEANGYKESRNMPLTDEYLHKITQVYRAKNGRNPSKLSDVVYLRDGNGAFVPTKDTFKKVHERLYHRSVQAGEQDRMTLSKWLKLNGYKKNDALNV